MPTTTIKFFQYQHLKPGSLARLVSKRFHDFAIRLELDLPDTTEKSAGMRKLLEAKDCFVRTTLEINDEELMKAILEAAQTTTLEELTSDSAADK